MSTEPERMPEGSRMDAIAALNSMALLIEEARENLLHAEDALALTALDLIRKGILPVRNSIGQWHDRVVCPGCDQEGRNIIAIRQGEILDDLWSGPIGYSDIGFRCQHCKLEWGFQVTTK